MAAVYALTAYDDGTGPALYAGGIFDEAGGVEVDGVARWGWLRLVTRRH